MKLKGIVTLVVLLIMVFTVVTCEEAKGMEHLEDNHTKYTAILKKVKDKKRYYKG